MPKKKKKVDYAYLESVSVEGFRTLKKTKVTFDPGLNIIIGPNGSGKSNLLKVLYDFYWDGETSDLGDSFEAKILTPSSVFSLSFEKIGYTLPKNGEGAFLPRKDIVQNNWKLYKDSELEYNSANNVPTAPYHFIVQDFYEMYVRFNLPEDAFTLLNPSNLTLKVLKMKVQESQYYALQNSEEGHSFMDYLISIAGIYDENKTIDQSIVERIKLSNNIMNNLIKFSPIQNVRLSKFGIQKHDDSVNISNIYFEFLVDDQWLSWPFLSDGTKRLFYLIHEVTRSGSTVLIEEPELGVHPHQFHSIMLFLKEQAQEKQIILTTHSPYALNVLGKEDLNSIIIAKLDKEKGSSFTHLTEKQKASAIRYMTEVAFLSDYWMHSDLEENEN